MKHLRLLALSLVNFKAVEELNIDFSGEDWEIRGDNATGKTTIYDGLTWLLFGKDSRGQTDFAIKPKGTSKIENSVKATFRHGDETVTLERIQHEKWTKPRGSVEKRFDGNRTKFKIDGVPAKMAEFKKYISEMSKEDLFRLLTNPLHFNENLHHTERREMLLTVCGTVNDADLVADLSALADFDGLQAIFDKTPNLEDHRKILAGERTLINNEIKDIPVRIDQITKDMPLANLDVANHPEKIRKIEETISNKRDRAAEIKAGNVDPADRQLRETLINRIQEHRASHAKGVNQAIDVIQTQIDDAKERKRKAKNSLFEANTQNTVLSAERQTIENQNDLLRNEWIQIDAKLTEFETHSVCRECHQDVPTGHPYRDEMIKSWNTRLAEIDEEGIQNKTRWTKIKEEVEKNEKVREVAEAEILQCQKEVEDLNSGILKARESKSEEIEEMERDLAAVTAKIENSKVDQDEITAIGMEINAMNEKVAELRSDIAVFEQKNSLKDKILELEEQEKTLAKRFEETERELWMIEGFIREKVSRLDEIINSKFSLVRFKLFEELQNGGIEDTCVCQIDGVDYKDLNSAARIQAGLDIIKTLSEYHEFSPVVFVDNRETIVELPDIPAQIISLTVDGEAKEMTFNMREDA